MMDDVVAWRREKRIELYTARKAMTAEQRHEAARRIAGRLDDHCIRRKPELVDSIGRSSTAQPAGTT